MNAAEPPGQPVPPVQVLQPVQPVQPVQAVQAVQAVPPVSPVLLLPAETPSLAWPSPELAIASEIHPFAAASQMPPPEPHAPHAPSADHEAAHRLLALSVDQKTARRLLAPAADQKAARHPPIRSFVLRAGRLGPGQARALAELAPRFVLPFVRAPLDAAATFGRRAPLVFEIGFGMGDATAEIAAARPDTDFIACEVHAPGVGALLQRINERALTNLRIVQHDAVEVLDHMLDPGSLAGVHVFFPDPWHKKKHNKRRLIQADLVHRLATRLAPGGSLHCATDWQAYAEQMLAVLGAEPLLQNTAQGYAERPTYRPLTKFENRGIRLGHGVWDLMFVRREP